MNVTFIPPTSEPCAARTTTDPAYFDDAPASFFNNNEGRLSVRLRQAAQMRNGNDILEFVAKMTAWNYKNPAAHIYSQDELTAMTQLAVTGSNAFAKWSANPTRDLTSYILNGGVGIDEATVLSQQIMSDFNLALQAVRNPRAGMDAATLRAKMKYKWIAVSGEDDPPDFPVNVPAPYPQFQLPITVHGMNLNMRFIIATSESESSSTICGSPGGGAGPSKPCIPPLDEIVMFIHGEGSRAEEAVPLIKALHDLGTTAGRSFTVIAPDLPGSNYSLRISPDGSRGMVPHLDVAPMPPSNIIAGKVETAPPNGSPVDDFMFDTLVAFIETLVVPFGNPITAIVGGSLGGHLGLRLAASQKSWVNSVIAWSPASIWDHSISFPLFSFKQRYLTAPVLEGRATEAENDASRSQYFSIVWDQPVFDASTIDWATVVAALIAVAAIPNVVVILLGVIAIEAMFGTIQTVPAQPQMWYGDEWPTKMVAINEDRIERREIYNEICRQWHWRLALELLDFQFDSLAAQINKPLLLLAGDFDDYPMVHIRTNVLEFAAKLSGPGEVGAVANTGHSIHHERPYFLASQILGFAARPAGTGAQPINVAILGDALVKPGDQKSFFVVVWGNNVNGSFIGAVTWTVIGAATLVSGQGTTNAVVSFNGKGVDVTEVDLIVEVQYCSAVLKAELRVYQLPATPPLPQWLENIATSAMFQQLINPLGPETLSSAERNSMLQLVQAAQKFVETASIFIAGEIARGAGGPPS